MKKTKIIIWSVSILSILIFVSPFLFGKSSDLVSLVSLASTILGAVATVATLIIAILLYDKFGLSSKLMEKQTDKVLELVDSLKEISFIVQGKKMKYFIQANRPKLESFKDIPDYKIDSGKQILISPDSYAQAIKGILLLGRSYWLPKEIKEKLKFFDVYGTQYVDNPSDESFVKLGFIFNYGETDWSSTFPAMTFQEFNSNLYKLVDEISNWIKKYTNISINFFNERN
jgi:hypothetical protein